MVNRENLWLKIKLMNKTKIIAVMGSGSKPHSEFSEPLGKWIAESGFHLLTGGGLGVMKEVSKAYVLSEKRSGMSIGIIPGEVKNKIYMAFPNYPNPWIEIPIFTHLHLSGCRGTNPMSRNHINILSADFIVVLTGRKGTLSEVELALRYKKPIVGFYKDFRLLDKQKLVIPHFDRLSELTKYIDQKISKKYHQLPGK